MITDPVILMIPHDMRLDIRLLKITGQPENYLFGFCNCLFDYKGKEIWELFIVYQLDAVTLL